MREDTNCRYPSCPEHPTPPGTDTNRIVVNGEVIGHAEPFLLAGRKCWRAIDNTGYGELATLIEREAGGDGHE